MSLTLLPEFVRNHYEAHEWKHAIAILSQDFPSEWRDICDVLSAFRLVRGAIESPGGRKSDVSEHFERAFQSNGWTPKSFQMDSPTHEVDCFKNEVAIEIEWNNKDPFYDRDLNNFRLLFDLRAISAGVIITRCDELQEIFKQLGRGASFGASTTHMSKLLPRIEGGGGGGCPLLVFGITSKLYVEGG